MEGHPLKPHAASPPRPALLGSLGWPTPRGLGTYPDGNLLVTTPDGVVKVDLAKAATNWILPVAGTRATPLTDTDGSLVTLCNYAAVRWHNDAVTIIGGGFTGNSNLLWGPDKMPWVFDSTRSMYAGLSSLTSLGRQLGDQQSHIIDSDLDAWNAGWLEDRRFFLAGNSYSVAVSIRPVWPTAPAGG
jgi:hypothetical protein